MRENGLDEAAWLAKLPISALRLMVF